MSFKTGFIIVVTALVTIVLMNNQDEVTFWIFGDVRISKLAGLAGMFGLGFILGAIALRPKKKPVNTFRVEEDEDEPLPKPSRNLSDEDRDYIS